jgi:hypothetical protein
LNVRHLNEEELLDLADGTTPESSALHLASCAECRGQLDGLRAAMSAAADADVPEPSPLFWDHLSAQIRERTAAESDGLNRWPLPFRWPRLAIPLAGLAVILMTFRPAEPIESSDSSPAESIAAVPDAGSASDAGDVQPPAPLTEDPSLVLIADLAGDLDWDSAAEAGLTTRSGAVERAIMELAPDERLELQEILKLELARQGRGA